MRIIPTLFAAALMAGPAAAMPMPVLPSLPYCGSGDIGYLRPHPTCQKAPDPTPEMVAEQEQRRQAYLAEQRAKEAEAIKALANAPLWLQYPSIVGGSVYVRSHTRCNSSKCWNVRSYTRSR